MGSDPTARFPSLPVPHVLEFFTVHTEGRRECSERVHVIIRNLELDPVRSPHDQLTQTIWKSPPTGFQNSQHAELATITTRTQYNRGGTALLWVYY